MQFSCSCCFLTDYDSLNPIVYCEICDTGVHQKCYGIDQETLEGFQESTEHIGTLLFTCDLCFARTKKRKELDEIFCNICKKNKGMMKFDNMDIDDILYSSQKSS